MSGGALHQDEMGVGRGEDGATYRCRVNGVAGERREEGARKRPTRRHCAVRIPKKMLWTRKIQTVVPPITKFPAKLDLGATAPPHDGNHSTCGYLGVLMEVPIKR